MKLSEIFAGFSVLAIGLLFAASIGGWVWNIIKIAHEIDATITGMFILRCIGIFLAPLGAILGFL